MYEPRRLGLICHDPVANKVIEANGEGHEPGDPRNAVCGMMRPPASLP